MGPRNVASGDSKRSIVTGAIIVIWTMVAIGNAAHFVFGVRFSRESSTGLELAVAAILVVLVLYVMASCIRHLYSASYPGRHRLAWLIFVLAGHIVGSTAYHIFIVFGSRKSLPADKRPPGADDTIDT